MKDEFILIGFWHASDCHAMPRAATQGQKCALTNPLKACTTMNFWLMGNCKLLHVRMLYNIPLVVCLPTHKGSVLSCKPRLFPHKLSIWPPCCTLLTGGMHNDLNMIPASKWMSFASFDCKCYLLSSVHVCHCLFWKLCLESTSLSLYCCAVGCEEYMAATILVFRVEQ